MTKFRITTSSYFGKDLKKLSRKNPTILEEVESLKEILGRDPYNRSHRYDIKKLSGLKPGEGQWRIKKGNWRLRYDIFGQDVVLYSIRHRKEAYR